MFTARNYRLRCWSMGSARVQGMVLTCLHLLRPPIRVLPVLPPLCPSIAPTFTIEQPLPFLVNSWWVSYVRHLSDVTHCSCSIWVCLWSTSPCLVPCSAPPLSLLCFPFLVQSMISSLDQLPLGFVPTVALSYQRIIPLQLHGSDDPWRHSFVPCSTFAIV